MKRDMVEYVNCLSGTDEEIFETLITSKFKKFRHFYRLLAESSMQIDNLFYNFTSESTLEVSLSLIDPSSKKDLIKFLKEKAGSQNNYDCNITSKKDKINVVITLEE